MPTMPVEIMLLPSWFPFHLSKISYWARTVLVPLLVLQALKPQREKSARVQIKELFVRPAETVREWPKGAHQSRGWIVFFDAVDALLKRTEPYFPKATRKRSIDRAVAFVEERLNGVDGLGAIFPAMVNSVLMFDAIGYSPDHPTSHRGARIDRTAARRQRRRGVLSALRVAGLGHRARLARPARSRRRDGRRPRARLASSG